MRRFVSMREALDSMSALAPRPWCKKVLTSLIEEGTLLCYAGGGHLVGRVPILCLLDDEKIAPGVGAAFWEAVREKYGYSAPSSDSGKSTPRGTLFQITGYRWYPDEPNPSHQVPFGYFHHADSLDWEAGELRIESLFPNEVQRELFSTDDTMFRDGGYLAQPRFSWLEFEVELTDLRFERGAIEMLTGLERPPSRPEQAVSSRRRKWDWEGALMHIVAVANGDPDGLPEGYGAQAKLETLIHDWFVARTGDAPAESEVRIRAKKILEVIDEGRTA